MELIRIKKESLERAGIPFKPGTLYKWKSIGKYPEMFTMIGDNLFVIKERWEKMVSEAIIKTDQRVVRLTKLKES